MNDDFKAFDDLGSLIDSYVKAASEENVMDMLETGAKEFVSILMKLSKPFSKINSPGYTHLIRTFAYKRNKDQVEVGWGKYYGPIVENGSIKNLAHPHVGPAWERNKEQIYKKMLKGAMKG